MGLLKLGRPLPVGRLVNYEYVEIIISRQSFYFCLTINLSTIFQNETIQINLNFNKGLNDSAHKTQLKYKNTSNIFIVK
ncbi:hypothetical protein BpHYR1_041662 [Brachionus plicatilis]|uniref:Uncharacterized protein n=1 Tax=Brachionus plicatilis TaxID=10195 RepID=A0A3M7STG0_BRAPC|nr:hypothetical protein BpHYR1_041662 [Brachionus plicatilis]